MLQIPPSLNQPRATILQADDDASFITVIRHFPVSRHHQDPFKIQHSAASSSLDSASTFDASTAPPDHHLRLLWAHPASDLYYPTPVNSTPPLLSLRRRRLITDQALIFTLTSRSHSDVTSRRVIFQHLRRRCFQDRLLSSLPSSSSRHHHLLGIIRLSPIVPPSSRDLQTKTWPLWGFGARGSALQRLPLQSTPLCLFGFEWLELFHNPNPIHIRSDPNPTINQVCFGRKLDDSESDLDAFRAVEFVTARISIQVIGDQV